MYNLIYNFICFLFKLQVNARAFTIFHYWFIKWFAIASKQYVIYIMQYFTETSRNPQAIRRQSYLPNISVH